MTIGTEQIARFKPGENLPVYATVAGDILAGRFVTISGRNTKNAYTGAHTGAAVAIGDPVKSDATGRAITQGGTGLILGYALQAATAAGQIIDVDLV
jgi:hypothetical protein